MKTKTLVNTLTSLRMISPQDDDFGGEVLSETILVKNIVQSFYSNAILLQKLVLFLDSNDPPSVLDAEILVNLRGMKLALAALKEAHDVPEASPEGDRRRGKIITRKDKTCQETCFFRNAKEALLKLQNDKISNQKLKHLLIESQLIDEELQDAYPHLEAIQLFCSGLVERIVVPQIIHAQEVEKLCASIALKQKFEKIVQRLKTHLDEIEQNRQDVVSQKQVEKVDLEERIQEIKECSNQIIHEHLEYVKSRMKVHAWNSHCKQSKILEQINELRKELEDAMDEHGEAEAQMRAENIKLESELKHLIINYDQEMFQRHQAIQKISQEYSKEKEALNELLAELDVVGGRRDQLKQEQREAQQRLIDIELQKIRRITACKTIQKAWRAHKTRMLLKSKKKKKKKAKS